VEPRLAQLLGLGEAESPDRQDLFAAWRLFFERLAEVYPTVLAFEDMQWADASLLDFVEHLLDWSRNHPLYVITLARPELVERRPTWGAGQRNFTSIYLDPLSEGAMSELLDGLVPGLPAGRSETGRERPALLALEVGEADVGGDAVQPGADRRPALERVVGLPRPQVGLLDHVLGLIHRAGHPVAVRDELASVALGHLVELLGGLARGALRLGHLVSWPRVPP